MATAACPQGNQALILIPIQYWKTAMPRFDGNKFRGLDMTYIKKDIYLVTIFSDDIMVKNYA